MCQLHWRRGASCSTGARPASLPPSPPSFTRESVELKTVKLEPVELESIMLEEVRDVSAVGGLRVLRKGQQA